MILSYHRNFKKDLLKVNDVKIKASLKAKILELKDKNELGEVSGVKKISGHPTAYRIRIGKYRLGLFYDDNKVALQRFVKRNDIYKLFP